MSKLNNNINSLLAPYEGPPNVGELANNYETAKEMKETFNQLVEHLNKIEFEVTLS